MSVGIGPKGTLTQSPPRHINANEIHCNFSRGFYGDVYMLIRPARHDDAAALADVLVRSITELCVLDHFGRQDVISLWTSNKTPENVARWIAGGEAAMFVAEEDGQILAGGGVQADGEINLNYIAPEARFRGVSKRLIAELEEHLRSLGVDEVRLESTQTARRFYLSVGYRAIAETPSRFGGAPSIAMRRTL